MDVEFALVKVPSYLGSNIMECPIKYCLRKYNHEFDIPLAYRDEKNAFIACIPSFKYVEFMRIAEEEECNITWMKTQKTMENDLSRTFVYKNGNEYILTKTI
jgi:predicted butyrate kinase (DUF1464 family)